MHVQQIISNYPKALMEAHALEKLPEKVNGLN